MRNGLRRSCAAAALVAILAAVLSGCAGSGAETVATRAASDYVAAILESDQSAVDHLTGEEVDIATERDALESSVGSLKVRISGTRGFKMPLGPEDGVLTVGDSDESPQTWMVYVVAKAEGSSMERTVRVTGLVFPRGRVVVDPLDP